MTAKKKIRLRHVNEAVGAMVLAALCLFVLGVILAGRAQGWFEGAVEIQAVFMEADGKSSAEQGSFDLQEGDEVKIRSAKAGRVISIEPLDDGGLKAVLEVKERFHRYVRVDSVARVKKMFGLAGDTHIEINEGQGEQIEDGGSIPCYKDEELMEIAKKALEQLETAIVPMVQETSGVMSNANLIAGDLSSGEGLIGSMITDPQLAEDVRDAVDHLNELLSEASATVRETGRLIKGAQRHWLLRKYIPTEEAREYISPLYGFYVKTDAALYRKCSDALAAARRTASPSEITRTAYNMSACLYGRSEIDKSRILLREAELSGAQDSVSIAHVSALKALLGGDDRAAAASFAALGVLDHAPKGMEFQEHSEFIAAAFLLLSRTGDTTKAKEVADEYLKRVEKKGSTPAKAAFCQGLARLPGTSSADSAGLSDREARLLSSSGLVYGMAKALERSGAYFARSKSYEDSALRYLAAAKSLRAQGFMGESDTALGKALAAAQHLDNKALAKHIEEITPLIKGESGK